MFIDAVLLSAMMGSMLDMLGTFQPLSLFLQTDIDGANLQNALQTLLTFAEEQHQHTDKNVQSLAISLQLSLGLLTGSVKTVARVAHLLSLTENADVNLHTSTLKLLEGCLAMEVDFKLAFPSNKYTSDKWSVGVDMTPQQTQELKQSPHLVTLACDESTVFVYNGILKSLQKVGTGYSETIAGEVMATNKDILQQVIAAKEAAGNPETYEEDDLKEVFGTMTVLKGKLYLKLSAVMKTSELAVFDADNLKFLSIVGTQPAVASFVEKNADTILPKFKKDTQVFHVDLTVSNTVFIRAADEHRIEVLSAVVDEIHDVTDLVSSHLSEKAKHIFIRDVLSILPASNIQPLKLSITCKYSIANVNEFAHLIAPLSHDGSNLIGMLQYPVIAVDRPQVYNIADLKIESAYFEAENHQGENIADVLKEFWLDYMEQYSKTCDNDDDDDHEKADAEATNIFNKIVEKLQESNGALNAEGKSLYVNVHYLDEVNNSHTCASSVDFSLLVDDVETIYHQCNYNHMAVFIDVENNFEVVKQISLPASEGISYQMCDILCNSAELICMESEADDSRIHISGMKFRMDGTKIQNADYILPKSLGLPSCFTYDVSNNVIYGYDVFNHKVIKWQNEGQAPTITDRKGDKDDFLAVGPKERLARLLSQPKINYSNVIWTLLEKMSEPFGCSHHNYANQVNLCNSIKLVAKYSTDDKPEKKCTLVHNNIPIVFDDELENACYGYHFAVFTPEYKFYKKALFNNEANGQSAISSMMGFIESIPDNFIVCVLNVNCIHDQMQRSSYECLTTIGLVDLDTLDRDFVKAFVAVGRKGLAPGQAEFVSCDKNETCTLTRLIPPVQAPLAVDNTVASITSLMKTTLETFEEIKPIVYSDNDDNEALMRLCSTLRVLQAHMYQYIRHADTKPLTTAIVDYITPFKAMLVTLADSNLMNRVYLEEATLSLFITCFETIYDSKEEQSKLFLEYTRQFAEGELNSSESKIFQMLLRRYDDPRSVLYVEKKNVNCSKAKDIFNGTVRIIQTYLNLYGLPIDSNNDRILSTAVDLLFSLTKLLLVNDTESIFRPEKNAVANVGGDMVFEIILTLSGLAQNIFSVALNNLQDRGSEDGYAVNLLKVLKKSPVGSVFPMAIMAFSGKSLSWMFKFY
jgi:hypothetical protein